MARNGGPSAHTRAELSEHTGYEPADDLFTASRIYIKHCEHPVKHHEIPPTFRIHHRGNRREGRYRIFTDLERDPERPSYACGEGRARPLRSSYGAPAGPGRSSATLSSRRPGEGSSRATPHN